MKSARREELQKMVRKQVADLLEQDADGGELLLKEVWEACDLPEETHAVEAYARKLSRELRKLP